MAPAGKLYKRLLDKQRKRGKIAPKKVKMSVKKPGKNLENELKEILKCQVCLTIMCAPIYQCSGGHPICSECKPNINNSCPICRKVVSDSRCWAFERIAQLIDHPCRFNSFGCVVVLSYDERLKHVECCKFRQYRCPYYKTDCAETRDITSIAAHMREDHHVPYLENESSFIIEYALSDSLETKNSAHFALASYDQQFFCVKLEGFLVKDAFFYVFSISFMGSEVDAKEFSYMLKVEGKGRKFEWQGIMKSICDRRECNGYDGLVISRELVRCFGEEMELKVEFTIWKNT